MFIVLFFQLFCRSINFEKQVGGGKLFATTRLFSYTWCWPLALASPSPTPPLCPPQVSVFLRIAPHDSAQQTQVPVSTRDAPFLPAASRRPAKNRNQFPPPTTFPAILSREMSLWFPVTQPRFFFTLNGRGQLLLVETCLSSIHFFPSSRRWKASLLVPWTDLQRKVVASFLTISFSMISITHGQWRSENIKWKSPEINHS